MKTVNVPVGKGYNVFIGGGICGDIASLLPVALPQKALVVSESRAYGICGARVCASLREVGCEVHTYFVPGGEAAKSFEYLEKILTAAAEAGLTREGLFLAVGGGSVSDITGLACALYMRGARFAAVPTTLLAAVDASVGGKTALDIHGGKNLVGTVYQPCAVVCDTETLTSDMRSAFYPGMSEAVKHGVISGGALFDSIKDGGFAEDIPAFIAANVALKAKYVAADENDLGIRRVLNFGHTFAHAAEAAGGYTVAHCDSVALGMYCEALLAEHIGICRRGTAEEIAGIAGRYNTFPALPPRKALLEAMSHDKKFSGGRRVFALPERIGSVGLREVGFGELCSFLDKLYM